MEVFQLQGLSQPCSRLVFGCEPLGGTDWGVVDVPQVFSAIEKALERGVNGFDTAGAYGLGQSEARLSEALGARRHEVVIVSKGGLRWEAVTSGRARVQKDGSPAALEADLAASLRRLRLDVLPVYLLHWPDPATPIEASVEALEGLRVRGLVQAIGLSNVDVPQLERAVGVAPISLVQLEHSLLGPLASRPTIAWCAGRGIPVAAYGTLAQGLLARGPQAFAHVDKDDRRSRSPRFQPEYLAQCQGCFQALDTVASQNGLTRGQVAVQWCLSTSGVAAAIVGVKTCRQIMDVVDGFERSRMLDFVQAAMLGSTEAPT